MPKNIIYDMRYIKTFEMRIKAETPEEIKYFGVEPEVIKLRDYLAVVAEHRPGYGKFVSLERNDLDSSNPDIKEQFKGRKTYSIVFDTLNNYFIFQLDYKTDGLWIKCDTACSTEELYHSINKLQHFFDAIAEEHTDFGWRFNRDIFLSEFDNMNTFIDANKYNL